MNQFFTIIQIKNKKSVENHLLLAATHKKGIGSYIHNGRDKEQH